jgi:hypothetical protein
VPLQIINFISSRQWIPIHLCLKDNAKREVSTMAKSLENFDIAQAEHEHDEKKGTGDAAPTSAFAGLTRAQCVRKFWRLYITGLGVSLAGMYVPAPSHQL